MARLFCSPTPQEASLLNAVNDTTSPCPSCGQRAPDRRTGHVVREVYDGVLFWSCESCGYAWSRRFDVPSLDIASKRESVAYLGTLAR